MAITTGLWGGAMPEMPVWSVSSDSHLRKCWWLVNGKMCLREMMPFVNKNAYFCSDYHETTYLDLRERKAK